jgi:hypothetical protein
MERHSIRTLLKDFSIQKRLKRQRDEKNLKQANWKELQSNRGILAVSEVTM